MTGPVNAREWAGTTVSGRGSGTDGMRRAFESVAIFALGVVLTAALTGPRPEASLAAAAAVPLPVATPAAAPSVEGEPSGRHVATTTAGAQYVALYSGVTARQCVPSSLRRPGLHPPISEIAAVLDRAC